MTNGQLTGGGGQGGQDFILKSSSDVKVGRMRWNDKAVKKENELNDKSLGPIFRH